MWNSSFCWNKAIASELISIIRAQLAVVALNIFLSFLILKESIDTSKKLFTILISQITFVNVKGSLNHDSANLNIWLSLDIRLSFSKNIKKIPGWRFYYKRKSFWGRHALLWLRKLKSGNSSRYVFCILAPSY